MTRDELLEWKNNVTTKKIFKELQELQEFHTAKAAKACLNNATADLVAIDNAFNAGICAGIEEILSFETEDVDES